MPEHTPHHDQQDEAVRHRLAEARHTDPIPAEVASRLDATLADLVADRATADGRGGVVPLRRRRWPALLAAAAAVTALGFALPTLTGDDDTHQLADRSVTAESAAPGPWSRATLAELGYTNLRPVPLVMFNASALDDVFDGAASPEAEVGKIPRDVEELSAQRSPEDWRQRMRRNLEQGYTDGAMADHLDPCGPTTVAPGVRIFSARTDGHRVLIAKHQPTADGVLVEVYDCSAKDPVTPAETFTLPPAE